MTKAEVAEVVLLLMQAYPNARLNDGTSQVYEQMLVDLDARAVREAVVGLVKTSKFVPTIAEIRDATETVLNRAQAAAARARAARVPSLPRSALVARERGKALPRASVVRLVPLQQAPAPREPRKWTAEELDAELANRRTE